MSEREPLLAVTGLNAFYGSAHILQDVEFEIGAEPVAIIGRNGMGKSTLCHSIMGLVPSVRGSVRFQGEDLVGKPPYRVASVGIGFVPQGRRLFPSLSTDEHLRMLGAPRDGGRARWTVDGIYELFPRLAERRRQLAGSLSGGEQQMLTIARSLMLAPDILLLDEPSEGLAPVVVDNLVASLLRLRAERLAVLLAEQSLRVALAVSDYVYVIEKGQIKHEATKDDFAEDEATRRRYLGV